MYYIKETIEDSVRVKGSHAVSHWLGLMTHYEEYMEHESGCIGGES